MRSWFLKAWFRWRDTSSGPVGWLLVAVLVVLIVVLGCALSGCTVLGERPRASLSLEADRQLAAAARRDAEVVLAGAKGGGHQATTQLLEGMVQGLGTLQAGPIGTAAVAAWPAEIVERVAAELRCEPVVRIEADPAVAAALDAERRARTAERQRAEAARGELDRLGTGAVWVADKLGTGGAAGVGGGMLLGLLGLAWKNRKGASAIYAYARAFQEVKHDAEAGREVDYAEVIVRHAGANGARAEIDRAYERAAGKRAAGRRPDLRERAKAALKRIKALRRKKHQP